MDQFTEWLEYYRIEPWGFEAEDARWGILNSNVLRAAGAKGVKPRDFMFGRHTQAAAQDVGAAILKHFRAPSKPAARPPPVQTSALGGPPGGP